MIVDGTDLSTLGVVIEDVRRYRDGVTMKLPNASVPGRFGHVLLTRLGRPDTRLIEVRGWIIPSDESLTTLLSNNDKIKYLLRRGDHNVTFSDAPTRYHIVRMETPQALTVDPALIQIAHRIRWRLRAVDPRSFSTTQDSIAFSTATAMPQGSAPTFPTINIVGAWSGGVITYKAFSGATVQTMDFTGVTVGAGNTFSIDTRTGIITNNGIWQPDALVGGDFIVLDPNDGDFTASEWPTLEITGSPASATAVYNRAYL